MTKLKWWVMILSRSHVSRPSHVCFQARNTIHSINMNIRNWEKKVWIHSNGGEAHKSSYLLANAVSASHLTFIPTNQEPLSSTGKWHLARNSLPPRHLLTKIISKILLKMRDLTTFAVTTSSSSVGISKMTYQIKADIARITLSIFLSLETNIAWPWYVCAVHL